MSFLLCIFLASTIWTFNALNKKQHYFIEVKLNYDSEWLKTWTTGGQPEKIRLEITGRGFDLANFLLNNRNPQININETILFNNKKELSSLELIEPFFSKFNNKITLDRLTPSSIPLPTKKPYFKKVAVKPNYDISLKSTYMISGPSLCVPDSIILSSKKPFPETLNTIYTTQFKKGNVSSTVFGNVGLMLPENLNLISEMKSVWIYIPVEESTEKVIDIVIKPEFIRAGNIELIPNIVTLTCRVPLSRYEKTTAEKFYIIALTTTNNQKKAVVSVKIAPFWAEHISTKPATVDYFYRNP